MAEQVALINLLMDSLADRLQEKLLTEVTGPTKAGLVRTGKLQDDPTKFKITILIHEGGEEWPDKINQNFTPAAGIFAGNAYEIGGNSVWRKYVRIEFQLFYPNQSSRDSARIKSNVVVARTRNAVHLWQPTELGKDDFGESCSSAQVVNHWIREGGGVGDFNWRGELIVEFLCDFEPEEET